MYLNDAADYLGYISEVFCSSEDSKAAVEWKSVTQLTKMLENLLLTFGIDLPISKFYKNANCSETFFKEIDLKMSGLIESFQQSVNHEQFCG